MSVVSLCVDNAGVVEINPVVFDFAVLSDCAALVVELANVVLSNAFPVVKLKIPDTSNHKHSVRRRPPFCMASVETQTSPEDLSSPEGSCSERPKMVGNPSPSCSSEVVVPSKEGTAPSKEPGVPSPAQLALLTGVGHCLPVPLADP
ncbi:hypothetical protein HPB47_013405 [Ixodes persulcatus]|uniref:Uncharacterized protein n=1 Tax=Ixodes persulcatus TaxID=34615 RepID=A0AC60R1A0_IXOPE|nr:hypothetical protein HPB47_013405 [Ixodes persulcatus]